MKEWFLEINNERMKQENIIQTKSYDFAVKIVMRYKSVIQKEKEYVLSKQLLRCGTSIGANVEEGIGGQTIEIKNERMKNERITKEDFS